MDLNREAVRKIVRMALDEDVGSGDISSLSLFPKEARANAVIVVKQDGVLAGASVAEAVFRQMDPELLWTPKMCDGQEASCGERLCELQGSLLGILAGERVALNFLQRMSGIATLTRRFVRAVDGLPVRILDTRKTTPGLRILEKHAVRLGGGHNHRFGLYDGILLKDTHLAAAGGVKQAVEQARRQAPHTIKIEVEVRTLQEVNEALAAGAEIILLDNMSAEEIQRAVRLINRCVPVEASGGVTLETVRKIAEAGVDYISVGALTHSAPALDLSLEIVAPI